VLVTSFSRSAATELVGRNLPIPREKVGTLHAHCFRALGRPVIAETKVSDWNESAREEWRVSGGTTNDLDESAADRTATASKGDLLLAQASRCRNQLLPTQLWPQGAVAFYRKWEEWKHSNGLLDFTDLLEQAARDIRVAPGRPHVIFADEAQDFTPLQLQIVRRWGAHAEYFVIVGDDDQTIYGFTGATPEAFITPDLPSDRKIVLSQSYRVPQAVHALAQKWISNVSKREPKEYRPTENEGAVIRTERHETWSQPDALVNDAEQRIRDGQSCMFLASCSYMLGPLRSCLIERGIPFHNPYRRTRGDWNPLGGAAGKTSAADRVLALLQPNPEAAGSGARLWTAGEFRAFTEWLPVKGNLTAGVRTAIKGLRDELELTEDEIAGMLMPEQFDALFGAEDVGGGLLEGPAYNLLEWWLQRVADGHKKTAAYPCRVAERRGVGALRERPRVMLGTIHSVKGGEADCVYLFPDLSMAGDREWAVGVGSLERDAIYRQFYVGMTRARDTLVICGAAGLMAVDL
jgi:DNA helicase II / ATP-dependent DNA helicase PcrA